MPFTYSSEYRQLVLEQVRAGRLVSELAQELEVCAATIHRWKAQDAIDRGEREGPSIGERAELSAARRRIRELEDELAATKLASELSAAGRVVRPKAAAPG